ncbi:MAG: zinc ribbon domain-containing protein [Verrucomicrobiae bacterium]|nr:zinc ribbon domain-containing protein [Verrucomicrobiae bacterium]
MAFQTPETCPVCGADVPPRARACPECGADEKSGWNEEDTRYDGLDLPDPDFNYDEFVKEEFGGAKRPKGISPLWWWVGIALLVLIIGYLVFTRVLLV